MDIEPVSHRLGQAPHGCKINSMLRRSLHESIKEALPFLAITHPFLAFYTNLLDTYWPVTYQEVRWGPLVLWWVRLCEVVMWPPTLSHTGEHPHHSVPGPKHPAPPTPSCPPSGHNQPPYSATPATSLPCTIMGWRLAGISGEIGPDALLLQATPQFQPGVFA